MNPLPFNHVAVLGLGLSGRSVLEFLSRRGLKSLGWDDNPLATPISQALHPSLWPWDTLDRLVVSPGIPLNHPVVQQARTLGVLVTGDVGLFFETKPQGRFIGITGTNGKSTTASLIHHVLKNLGYSTFLGGNIGVPLTSAPDLGSQGIYVLELSSYQLELNPHLPLTLPVLTQISRDHLERHGTLEAYVAAKAKIFRASHPKNGLIGISTPESLHLYQQNPHLTPVSPEPFAASFHLDEKKEWIISPQALPLVQLHKLMPSGGCAHPTTLLVAYSTLVTFLTLWAKDPEKILEIPPLFQTFPGLPHRQENLGTYGGITYVNDSKATNAPALKSSLERFCPHGTLYWIGGGRPKQDDGALDTLLKIPQFWTSVAWCGLFGEARQSLYQALSHHPQRFQAEFLSDVMEEAHAHIRLTSPLNPLILFSPGCSSFDQFANFEERGTVFKHCIPGFIYASSL